MEDGEDLAIRENRPILPHEKIYGIGINPPHAANVDHREQLLRRRVSRGKLP